MRYQEKKSGSHRNKEVKKKANDTRLMAKEKRSEEELAGKLEGHALHHNGGVWLGRGELEQESGVMVGQFSRLSRGKLVDWPVLSVTLELNSPHHVFWLKRKTLRSYPSLEIIIGNSDFDRCICRAAGCCYRKAPIRA